MARAKFLIFKIALCRYKLLENLSLPGKCIFIKMKFKKSL